MLSIASETCATYENEFVFSLRSSLSLLWEVNRTLLRARGGQASKFFTVRSTRSEKKKKKTVPIQVNRNLICIIDDFQVERTHLITYRVTKKKKPSMVLELLYIFFIHFIFTAKVYIVFNAAWFLAI